jgi:hypothetical protein
MRQREVRRTVGRRVTTVEVGETGRARRAVFEGNSAVVGRA